MAAKVFQDGFSTDVGTIEERFVRHDHLVILLYRAGEKLSPGTKLRDRHLHLDCLVIEPTKGRPKFFKARKLHHSGLYLDASANSADALVLSGRLLRLRTSRNQPPRATCSPRTGPSA